MSLSKPPEDNGKEREEESQWAVQEDGVEDEPGQYPRHLSRQGDPHPHRQPLPTPVPGCLVAAKKDGLVMWLLWVCFYNMAFLD